MFFTENRGGKMILFLIPILIMILLFFLQLSKSISKMIAVFIDFLFIGGFVAYLLHGKVSTKIASGHAIYFWNIVFGIGSCLIYYLLLTLLVMKFPKIAAVVNYIIAWFGTLIMYGLLFSVFIGGFPRLLNNSELSMLTNLLIVTLLAFVTFKIRKNIFSTPDEYSS